jgi:hypothetical protein
MDLTKQDRCDCCPAEALLVVDIGGSDLIFCGHHGNQYQKAIEAKGGIFVVDNRDPEFAAKFKTAEETKA